MTISLRTRLLSGSIAGTAVLLVLFCVTVYAVTRRNMILRFDESLLSTARMLSAVIEKEDPQRAPQPGRDEPDAPRKPAAKLDFEFDVRMTPEFNEFDGGAYYVFYGPDGQVMMRSPSLGGRDLPTFADAGGEPTYRRCILPDGKIGRTIRYPFRPRLEGGGRAKQEVFTVVVGRGAGELCAFLRFLRWLLAGSSAGIVVLSAAVGSAVTRAGLQPLRALARQIETVDAQSLERTFAADGCPAELIPICKCLNDLMERIRSSFQRQRRFNADVAHELRTPLAGMQSTIEVCLRADRQSKEYRRTLTGCLKIVRAMHRMVDTLLDLARLDAKQVGLKLEEIPLRHLIEDTWRLFADRAFDRNVSFQNLVDERIVILCDRDHLAMILSNILDNAAEYCDAGGRIVVETQSMPGWTALAVSNTAAALTREDAGRVFDCFWRADPARTGTGLHCGIGLNVVERLAAILGMRVEAQLQPSGVFTIRLLMPAATA